MAEEDPPPSSAPPPAPAPAPPPPDVENELDERVSWLKAKACPGLDISPSLFLSFFCRDPAPIADFLDDIATSSASSSPQQQQQQHQRHLPLLLLYTTTTPRGSLRLNACHAFHSRPNLGPSPSRFMYFLKLRPGPLTSPRDMETLLEFGVLPAGPSFESLEQLLLQLFLPILTQEELSESKFWALRNTSAVDRIGNELQSNMQRFLFQVSSAKQLLCQGAMISVPSLPANCIGKHEVDYDLLLELETAANDWPPVIETAIQQELHKVKDIPKSRFHL